MADSGVGIDLDSTAETLAIVYSLAVVSFLGIFTAIMWRMTNEVLIARRAIWWVRGCFVVLFVMGFIQVVYEINITQTLTFPMYGAARPTAHLLLIFVGFFVNSHSCFRWLVLFGQLLFIVFDTLSVAYVATLIDCKQDNTCLSEDGWDEQQLRVIEARHYICIFVEIWSVLIIGYLMAVIGLCRPRYPVRLFSTSQPLASLPASCTQYGRIASANAKLETV